MIPPGAKIRPSRMTCPRFSPFPTPLCPFLPPFYPSVWWSIRERGAEILFESGSISACTGRISSLASIDRPSLFIREGINKRCRETVYSARSDDKIRPCKSAGYLTGRWTIFEYLSLSPPHRLFFLCPVIRVLLLFSLRSFAPAVLYYFMLVDLFFCVFLFFFKGWLVRP